jgi:hypothetical protein
MVAVGEVGHTGLENIGTLEGQDLGGTVPFVGQGWEDIEPFAVPGLAAAVGIVDQPLLPTDPKALLESRGLAGPEAASAEAVLREGKKELGRERVARDQRRSLAGDTPGRIALVGKANILVESEHEENMAELEEVGNSPTFGQEGAVFGQVAVEKVHGGGRC